MEVCLQPGWGAITVDGPYARPFAFWRIEQAIRIGCFSFCKYNRIDAVTVVTALYRLLKFWGDWKAGIVSILLQGAKNRLPRKAARTMGVQDMDKVDHVRVGQQKAPVGNCFFDLGPQVFQRLGISLH